MEESFMYFSKNLKILRSIYNMKQNELAEKTGISRSVISYYESGKSEPTLSVVKKIANVFNVSMDILVSKELSNVEFSEDVNLIFDEQLNNNFLEDLFNLKNFYLKELERMKEAVNFEIPNKIKQIDEIINIVTRKNS